MTLKLILDSKVTFKKYSVLSSDFVLVNRGKLTLFGEKTEGVVWILWAFVVQ